MGEGHVGTGGKNGLDEQRPGGRGRGRTMGLCSGSFLGQDVGGAKGVA